MNPLELIAVASGFVLVCCIVLLDKLPKDATYRRQLTMFGAGVSGIFLGVMVTSDILVSNPAAMVWFLFFVLWIARILFIFLAAGMVLVISCFAWARWKDWGDLSLGEIIERIEQSEKKEVKDEK